jgi:hypothetical protein
MKRENVIIPRRFWYWRIGLIVLILHLLVYVLVWAVAISQALAIDEYIQSGTVISVFQNQILFALFWLPVFLIHIGTHLYFAGRSDGGGVERQAYREGFRDGTRYSTDDTYDARHLTIDDDDEIVEMRLEEKQKRGEL